LNYGAAVVLAVVLAEIQVQVEVVRVVNMLVQYTHMMRIHN
jgi:hypothetical protein